MKNNFVCPKTGKTFFIANYRTHYNSEGNIKKYTDSSNKELKNPENNVALVFVEPTGVDFSSIKIGTFNSLSSEEKRKMLRKRSIEDSKKPENQDRKREVEERQLNHLKKTL